MDKKYKLEIPRKYINLLNDKELESVTFKVQDKQYSLNKDDINLLHNVEYLTPNPSFPLSWYKEILVPEFQIDVKNLIELAEVEKKTICFLLHKSLHLRGEDKVVLFIYNHIWNTYTQIDDNQSGIGRPTVFYDLNYPDIRIPLYYTILEEDDIDKMIVPLRRYYVWPKKWYEKYGSSGGGNITPLLSEKRLEEIYPSEKYNRTAVGVMGHRLSPKFHSDMKNLLLKENE